MNNAITSREAFLDRFIMSRDVKYAILQKHQPRNRLFSRFLRFVNDALSVAYAEENIDRLIRDCKGYIGNKKEGD